MVVDPQAAGAPRADDRARDARERPSLRGRRAVRQTSLWRDAVRRFTHNSGALIAAVAFVIMLLYVVIVAVVVSPYDPNAVDFSQRVPDADAGRTRSAPTSSAATSSSAPRSAAASRSRSASPRRSRSWSSASSTARSRASSAAALDNAMMRFLDALYGLPYLPFAIITLAIFGTVNFWTMVVALTIASLVHDRARHARPDHHAEGERLRARGARGRRALVPGALPPPAAEHARRR